jgi:hypothetical protein
LVEVVELFEVLWARDMLVSAATGLGFRCDGLIAAELNLVDAVAEVVLAAELRFLWDIRCGNIIRVKLVELQGYLIRPLGFVYLSRLSCGVRLQRRIRWRRSLSH